MSSVCLSPHVRPGRLPGPPRPPLALASVQRPQGCVKDSGDMSLRTEEKGGPGRNLWTDTNPERQAPVRRSLGVDPVRSPGGPSHRTSTGDLRSDYGRKDPLVEGRPFDSESSRPSEVPRHSSTDDSDGRRRGPPLVPDRGRLTDEVALCSTVSLNLPLSVTPGPRRDSLRDPN